MPKHVEVTTYPSQRRAHLASEDALRRSWTGNAMTLCGQLGYPQSAVNVDIANLPPCRRCQRHPDVYVEE